MITVRRGEDRGVTKTSWLTGRHSFSFGEYYDPERMGFRTLRVINDDLVEPGKGFGMHGHRDMEIITVVLEGELEHKDSLGHGAVLRPGEVQVMSAGRGIRHSEFNPSSSRRVHLLQIWIMPERTGLEPAYAQADFPLAKRADTLLRVAGKGRAQSDGALKIRQDADLYVSLLSPGRSVSVQIKPGRAAWVHVATGEAVVQGALLKAGDAAAIEDEAKVEITGAGASAAQVLLFDLA